MKSTGESNVFSTNKILNVGGRLIDLSVPRVMGVINVTPDSFFSGSRLDKEENLLKAAEKMLSDGATFLDIGGYSTRPGAADVSPEIESERVTTAIRAIISHFPEAIISIDTFRASVAVRAVEEGARLINDVSGGALDSQMYQTVAGLGVPYILMHMRGTPQTMTSHTDYQNMTKEIADYFQQKIHALHSLHVKDIIIDPGFGFAKTSTQNFELLQHLTYFQMLGKPLLVGLSRKSMI